MQSLGKTPNTRKLLHNGPRCCSTYLGPPAAAPGAAVWWQPRFDCSQRHAGTRLEVRSSKHSFPRADLIIYIFSPLQTSCVIQGRAFTTRIVLKEAVSLKYDKSSRKLPKKSQFGTGLSDVLKPAGVAELRALRRSWL